MKKEFITGMAALAIAACSHGAQIPEAAKKDARIRFADYDPHDVVTIYARVGLETHLVLDPDERIVDMTGGDVEAWGVATKLARNGVFLKPAGELPDANLHVITDKRTYSLDLKLARKAKGEIGFMTVYFRYPNVQKVEAVAVKEADAVKVALDASPPAANRRYSVLGSDALAPVEAWDDGRTTFLRFRARSSIPAVYSTGGEDVSAEQIENISVENDVVQVHGVRQKIVLRIGRQVACVFNDGFDPRASRPATNTVSPLVKRTLKGSGK
jgi:type IV secretion system protein VirB9